MVALKVILEPTLIKAILLSGYQICDLGNSIRKLSFYFITVMADLTSLNLLKFQIINVPCDLITFTNIKLNEFVFLTAFKEQTKVLVIQTLLEVNVLTFNFSVKNAFYDTSVKSNISFENK